MKERLQSCSYENEDYGHSSKIQIERDYSCDVLFCVYLQQQSTAPAAHNN